MPNRGQTQGPQRGRRNPTQTSPDDDEAQLADQTRLDDEDTDVDTEGQQPLETKRRGLQTSQEREEERLAQADNEDFGEDEADDDEDTDDTIGPTS